MAAAVRKAVADYNESNSRNVNDNYDPFWPGPFFTFGAFLVCVWWGGVCGQNTEINRGASS